MTDILIPVLIITAIGLVAGIGLSFAAVKLAVKKDETEEKVRAELPGANCGACGFSGCDGYAVALSKGECAPNLCAPGGQAVAEAVGNILGVSAEMAEPKKANVRCSGACSVTGRKAYYSGINTCAAASVVAFGGKECQFGCIGFGDCQKVCPVGAIDISDGIASINDKCIGCGICTSACPKKLIKIAPKTAKVFVNCKSSAKGPQVMKVCKVGCISCGLCQKVCPNEAISLDEKNYPKINYDKCTACGLCAQKCPKKIISVEN